MSYTLDYLDRWRRVDESKIESDTTGSIAFATIPDNTPTRLIAEWTGKQYTKLLSALYTGANLMFPEEANEIIWQLIKVVHQPIQFPTDESGDCFNYLPSAPFVYFTPQNPYNQPDYIPDGLLAPPFFVNSDFEYPSEFGYLATDVFIDPASINIDPIDLITLNVPTIKIRVFGSGQIELDLLAVGLGSQAIIKVGSPPNIFDIIEDGITDDVTIVDLNADNLSVPPETDIVYSEEINIEAESGVATDVYIAFIPNLDDSLIPLRYGGGIRQIGLCGFESEAINMGGIEDIRIVPDFENQTYHMLKRVLGVWEPVEGWEEFYTFDTNPRIQQGITALAMAIGMHDVEDWGAPYPNEGFVGSPLQEYIDSATGFDPSALEAAIAAAQADADTAQAAAAAAQSTANSAQATANGAVTVNNTQNTAITAQAGYIGDLQTRMDDAEDAITAHNVDIATLQAWQVLAQLSLTDLLQFQSDMPPPFGVVIDFANDGLPDNMDLIHGNLVVGGIYSEDFNGHQYIRLDQTLPANTNPQFGQGNVYGARIACEWVSTVGDTIYAGIHGSNPPDVVQLHRPVSGEFDIYVWRFNGNDYVEFGIEVHTIDTTQFRVRAITLFGWGFPNPL